MQTAARIWTSPCRLPGVPEDLDDVEDRKKNIISIENSCQERDGGSVPRRAYVINELASNAGQAVGFKVPPLKAHR